MRKSGSVSILVSMLLSSTGYAQSTSDVSRTSGENAAGQPGEIIVTAQRREEALSKTPVSVAVVSGDTLAKAQIVSEQDLRTATPGLLIKSGFSSNIMNYALRGQSVDAFSASRPGVLPYFNEIQIGGTGASSAFYDLQSVQVLKGPQGTLFGRSATGGAVLFTSATPTDDFGGYISLLAGNYSAKKVEGAINVPLIADTLKARVAGFWSERNGFQKNLWDGTRQGDYERYGVRGSAALETGALRNTLVVDYYRMTGTNNTNVVTQMVTGGFPLPALYAGTATPQDRALGIATVQAFLGGANTPAGALVPAFYDSYFADPRRPRGGLAQHIADQNARGPFVVNSDALTDVSTKNLIISNKTVFEIGDETEIRNIIGYTRLKTDQALDDGLPFNVAQNNVKNGNGKGAPNFTRQFSDELQIAGTAFSGKLNYVVGGFYSDERYEQSNYFTSLDILLGGFIADFHYKLENKTRALYAQGTYALNDSGLSVTIGGRYTSEKVRKFVFPGDTNRVQLGDPPPPGYSYDKSTTFKKFSWSLGIQNQFDENTLLYAASRRAYKNGGYNGTAPPLDGRPDQGGDSVNAEQVTDVELGLKHRSYGGGVQKRFNIAAFYTWIKGRHTLAYFFNQGTANSATVNVPTSTVYGLEIDGQIGPISGFTLGGSFNYTKGKFGSKPTAVPGPGTVVFDVYPDTPKFSGLIYGDYVVPVSGSVEALFRAEVYSQSKVFSYPLNDFNQGSVLPGYTLVSFRVGLEDSEAGWSLTGNLKNAFDKIHYVGGIPLGAVLAVNNRSVGDPRTFTIEARYKF